MKINKIIHEGEMLNAEQLAQVTGGVTPSNTNIYDGCKCSGSGLNINGGFSCTCLNPSNCLPHLKSLYICQTRAVPLMDNKH